MKKIPEEYKKRYYFTILVIVPICLIIGLIIAIKVASLLNFKVDFIGLTFVSFFIIAIYVMGMIIIRRTFQQVIPEEKDSLND
jgi:uncharacterized BrkB/YihY/UPF0761 family membrane protein